jgi:cell cycle sensor histidine kinase DivJ
MISRLLGPLLVWLATVSAGLCVAGFRGATLETLVPLAVLLCTPAILSVLLVPAAHRDWGQALILLIWAGFSVLVALIGGPIWLWVVFMTVPIMGMLFFKGRVLEGFVLAVIALLATYFGADYLGVPDSPLSNLSLRLLGLVSVAATLALLIAAMMTATEGRQSSGMLASGVSSGGVSSGGISREGSGIPWRQGVSGGLFEFDARNRLTASNAIGAQQFGLDGLNETLTLADLADDDAASARLIEAASKAKQTGAACVTRIALGPTASEFAHLDARFTPIPGGGLLLHTIDRSDEEARLEALQRSHSVAEQEAADKTLFFAGVSHELRTPLNAIIGFSDMMRSRLFGPLPGKYAEYADLIHDSGQYMLDLIGDVLDLSKVESGRYTLSVDTFDLSDVVRSSVKMIRPAADAADVALNIDLPQDDALLLTADRKAVRQMLLNLLSNAVKFSPKGSHIHITAREDTDQINLSVADQGPGMSADELANIGQPFTQGAAGRSTEARGSGLGLSLVRQLAELHGGRLDIESEVGDGTTARVILPVTAQT